MSINSKQLHTLVQLKFKTVLYGVCNKTIAIEKKTLKSFVFGILAI